MVIWEISRVGFRGFWQTNRQKTAFPAFPESKEGVGSICSWLWGWRYSGWSSIYNALSRPVFYSITGGSAINRNPGRWFIFLFRETPCDGARQCDSSDSQRIWNLLLAYLKSKTSIHLWNAYGSGMERRLYLLFTESGKQPCKQSTEKIEGFPWSAGLCKKRLRYRL